MGRGKALSPVLVLRISDTLLSDQVHLNVTVTQRLPLDIQQRHETNCKTSMIWAVPVYRVKEV